jgi:hypothetical protein
MKRFFRMVGQAGHAAVEDVRYPWLRYCREKQRERENMILDGRFLDAWLFEASEEGEKDRKLGK